MENQPGTRGRPPSFVLAQEEAAGSLRQGKLTFAMRVNTALAGGQGGVAVGPGATAPGAAATSEAADQDVGMQGAG